ncbi:MULTISPECIES: GAF and ANTAR domain-containing protein [unclassified Arthrobacter]|uniref:GAF and ANTAR domain-containing protein n=1 Tax=unclassified Arthrobacter TaxID=235627 RepID=UPI001F1FAE21|nr:GAF and ANTAR domain-containing protein [Arthrobacter sp. FW305-BF8]UKA56573.1 GAF and ANTAR domain-containing protein [Arthrobacter sp. FW305-BF8]
MLLDTQDVQDFLDELARFSAESMSGPRGQVYCGITLLRHRSAATVASSSEHAQAVDEIQYQFGDGPCLRSCREGVLVHVPDFELDSEFPDYNDTVLKNGIRSVLAVPFELPGADARAGLNLYSEKPNAFDASAVERAVNYVRQASKGLRLAVLLAQRTDNAANLRKAMESRTMIDTAVGIIIAQNRCSQEDAINLIKSASSTRNLKLRDVAAAIVESAGGGPLATHFD